MISFKKSGYTAIGCVASLVDRYKKKSEWESSEVYSLTFQVRPTWKAGIKFRSP